jgi:hypothetical protein
VIGAILVAIFLLAVMALFIRTFFRDDTYKRLSHRAKRSDLDAADSHYGDLAGMDILSL